MATRGQLAVSPLQALSPALLNMATASRAAVGLPQHYYEPFDFSPQAMWRTATSILRTASPWLERGVVVLTPFAILGFGLYTYVWKGFGLSHLSNFARSYFSAGVVIPNHHPMYHQVLEWVADKHVGGTSRSIKLHSSAVAVDSLNQNGLSRMEEMLEGYSPSHAARGRAKRHSSKTSLSYIPTAKSTRFTFKGHTLWLRYSEAQYPKDQHYDEYAPSARKGLGLKSGEPDLKIVCNIVFGGLTTIKALLEHIASENQSKMQSKLRIHRLSRALGQPNYATRGDDHVWDHNVITRPIRSLEMVSMDPSRKQGLIEDIEKYLSPSSQKWYTDRGIPWRRGYLFYGPPGTGKTSICSALAGHFNLDMYILSLSHPKLDDELLSQCFDRLPSRCLVLIEDVDSAGVGRETDKNKEDETAREEKRRKKKADQLANPWERKQGRVTLAGLLNTIDGPVSQEGRVLVMTTNSPDLLDQALLRPGRVDRKVLFSNATHEVTKQIFMNTFGEVSSDKSKASPHPNTDLQVLAEQFALNIPEDTLTPAEIQNYLMEHFENPEGATYGAKSWAERLIQTKSEGRNVEAFTGQIGVDEKQEEDHVENNAALENGSALTNGALHLKSVLKKAPNGAGQHVPDLTFLNGGTGGSVSLDSLCAALGKNGTGDGLSFLQQMVRGGLDTT